MHVKRYAAFAFSIIAVVMSSAKADKQPAKTQLIRIGMSGTLTPETDRSSEKSARDALSGLIKKETGFANEIVHQKGWRELADQMAKGRLELGIFQGYEFAWITESNHHLKALVLAVDGPRYSQVCMFTRRDNPIKGFDGLEGQSICLPHTPHWQTRLFVDRNCRAIGKSPEAFFSRITSAHSPEDALDEVIDGSISATVVDQVVLEAYKRRKPGRFDQLHKVTCSKPFPPTVIAYDDRVLDETIRRQIRDGLLRATAKEKDTIVMSLLRWTGFEPVPDDFEQILIETRQAYPAPIPSN